MVIMELLKKKMKNHGKFSLNIILPLNFKFKTFIRNYLLFICYEVLCFVYIRRFRFWWSTTYFLCNPNIREGVRGVAGVASATPYFGHNRIGTGYDR